MAFQVGTQVRPELGRADLSGFERSGQYIGQALANLGQEIGAGIENYQKNKTITATSLAQLEALGATNPEAIAAVKAAGGDLAKSYANIEKGDYKQRDVLSTLGAMQTYVSEQDRQRQIKLQAFEEQLAQSKLDLARQTEARVAKTSETEQALAERRVALGEKELELKQSIAEAQMNGDPAAARQAEAELGKTQAETDKLKAQTAELGKPKPMTPTERMRLIETQVGDVTFGQYLQELKQTKKIKGGELHQRGLFNFDEDQIAAFDNIMRTYPEFLKGMPQAVKDYYATKNDAPTSVTLGNGTTVTLAPQ
jgi:hypothetical protein